MVTEINQTELETLIKEKEIVIVDFSASWCGPCKSLGRILETKVAPEIDKDDSISLVKIDIDNNKDLAEALQILSVPTMMFFFKGQRIVFQGQNGKSEDRVVGFDPNVDKMIFSLVENLKKNSATTTT